MLDNIKPIKPERGSKLGIALDTIGGQPINGLRHLPKKGTNGWYIWCGTRFSKSPNFFKPIHIEYIDEYIPEIKTYLNLPPGYRFLIDKNGYEDVWFDESLIK